MKRQERKLGLAFYTILTILVFIIDVPTPRGIGISILYAFPVWGVGRQRDKKNILIISILGTFLLVLGYILSPPGIKPEYLAILNRILGIAVLWIFTCFILKQSKSENKSKRNEQILNLILENINEGIIVSDARDGKVEAISRWGLNYTMAKSIDTLTAPPLEPYIEQWDVRNPITGEKIKPEGLPLARALKGEVIKNEELQMIRPDGTCIIASINAVPIYNPENSEIINAVASWKDITDRKKAEEDLINEKKMADELADFNLEILEVSPYGVATYDESGNCTYTNEALCKIIGASRTQVLAQNFYQIRSWKESGLYELAVEALYKGELQSNEVHHITSFGKEIEAECKFIPFKVHGKINLLFMLNDITDYKRIEKELNKSRKQLENVIDYAMDGIMVIDENQRILIFNGACEKIFLTDIKEAIGQSIERFIPYRFLEQHKQNIMLFVKESKPYKMMGKYGVVTGVRSTGEEFPMEASVSQYEIDGRKYYTVIHRDITERKRVEEALLRSEEKFSKAFSTNPNALVLSKLDEGTILEVNETFLKLFGYELNEVIGSNYINLSMYVDNRDRDKAVDLLRRDGKIRDFEVQIRTKAGQERTAVLNAELLLINGEQSILTIIQDITELKMEKMKWQGIVEGMTEEVWVCDADGKIDLIKLGEASLMGLSEFKGKSLKEVLDEVEIFNIDWHPRPPEDSPLLRSFKGEIVRGEEIMKHKFTGVTRIRQYSSAPMRDKNGEITGAVAIVRDITEQVENKQKLEKLLIQLKDNEEKLLDAQKLVLMGNYSLDVRTGIIEWSDQMYDLWEVSRDKPIPKFDELWERIYPDDRENVTKVLSQEIKENEKVETEFRILFPDKRIKYIHVITRGYFDESGNLIKRQGVEIDITERKLQQKKLEDTLAELRNSEAKLLEAQKLSHIGSFEIELESGKIKWSEEVFNIYERDINAGEPSYEEALGFMHPEDKDYCLEEVKKWMESSRHFEIDYRIIVNNKIKYIHYIGKSVLDSTGKVIKRTGAIMDVTERKLVQIKMEEILNDLKRSNQDLEQFAYIASHDLQEPIRMIKSYTDLLIRKHKEKLNEEALEYFGFISGSSIRMQQLVSDILKYSRLSTQAQPFKTLDSNEILSEVLSDLKFSIQDTNTIIKLEKLPVIKGDRTQIRQVFQNLIQNAIKFTKDTKPLIEIKCKKKKGFWLFSVKDNGIGIDQKHLERIFVIFQRLHTKEEYPGTGMGLAIVKKIIERHGGEVCAESEPGKGAVFYFTLPAD